MEGFVLKVKDDTGSADRYYSGRFYKNHGLKFAVVVKSVADSKVYLRYGRAYDSLKKHRFVNHCFEVVELNSGMLRPSFS